MTDLNSEFIPTLRYATERDVDLLLVEEIKASPEFTAFIISKLGMSISAHEITHWDCKHSTSRLTHRREIDIRIFAITESGKSLIALLENKIGADDQPEQGESYKEECGVLLAAGKADWVRCGLIAPATYFPVYPTFASHFHARITYESVASFLNVRMGETAPELQRRLSHRIELLDQAVGKQRRGYEPVLVSSISSFNKLYMSLAEKMAPELRPGPGMRDGSDKPGDSVSMIFDEKSIFSAMPANVQPRRFSHELGRGQEHRANYVQITLPKLGMAYRANKAKFEAALAGTPYKLQTRITKSRPNPGLVLYEPTAAIDNQGDLESQRSLIEEGILAAQRLRIWTLENYKLFERWYEVGARS